MSPKNVSASSCKRLEHEQLVVIGGRGMSEGEGVAGSPLLPLKAKLGQPEIHLQERSSCILP